MNNSNLEDNKDRRRFFRIDDEVSLHYRVVDEETILAASQLTDDLLSSCSLVTALDELDQAAKIIMHRVEKNQPAIAEYLRIMDSKISLLTQEVFRHGHDFSESNVRHANISATGLAFENNESLQEGKLLEIKLLLTSCFAVIKIYGKVIYCKKSSSQNDKFPFYIGIDYINLVEQDREVLIKHVVKRQMQQIRELKEEE